MRTTIKSLFMASLVLNVALVPLAMSEYLRFIYVQTVARWVAKVYPPHTVFVGDSITASGRNFNRLGDINLGSNGLNSLQIAGGIDVALAFRPKNIAVMGGVNDTIGMMTDLASVRESWRSICRHKNVIVTLPTPTRDAQVNQRLADIRKVIAEECALRKTLSLSKLADAHGFIQLRYTVDGTHLSDAALDIWKQELSAAGI